MNRRDFLKVWVEATAALTVVSIMPSAVLALGDPIVSPSAASFDFAIVDHDEWDNGVRSTLLLNHKGLVTEKMIMVGGLALKTATSKGLRVEKAYLVSKTIKEMIRDRLYSEYGRDYRRHEKSLGRMDIWINGKPLNA